MFFCMLILLLLHAQDISYYFISKPNILLFNDNNQISSRLSCQFCKVFKTNNSLNLWNSWGYIFLQVNPATEVQTTVCVCDIVEACLCLKTHVIRIF